MKGSEDVETLGWQMGDPYDKRQTLPLDFHTGISWWGRLEASSLVLGIKIFNGSLTSETILHSVSYQLSQTGADTVSLPLNQRVSDFACHQRVLEKG